MKLGKILLLLVGLCALALPAAAQTLDISQTDQLSFGALEQPSGGAQTFTISPMGGTSGSGSQLYGSTSRGAYLIRNTGPLPPTSTITIEVVNVNPNASGLTLSDFTGRYNGVDISSFPAVGMTAPAAGASIPLYIGATATYTSAVATGSSTPSFDIVVTYE